MMVAGLLPSAQGVPSGGVGDSPSGPHVRTVSMLLFSSFARGFSSKDDSLHSM